MHFVDTAYTNPAHIISGLLELVSETERSLTLQRFEQLALICEGYFHQSFYTLSLPISPVDTSSRSLSLAMTS